MGTHKKRWRRWKRNLAPGDSRGTKAKRNRRGLLPLAMGWDGRRYRFHRSMERVPGDDRDWYKPFARTVNRRDRRKPGKPR